MNRLDEDYGYDDGDEGNSGGGGDDANNDYADDNRNVDRP